MVRDRVEPLPRGLERLSPLLVVVLFVIYAFTLLLVGGWSYHLRQSAAEMEKKIALHRRVFEPSDHPSPHFWKSNRRLIALLREARDITRTELHCSQTLALIARERPPEATLQSIQLYPTEIRIRGRARTRSIHPIEQFTESLEDSNLPLLQGVELQDLSEDTQANECAQQSEYVFTIRGHR